MKVYIGPYINHWSTSGVERRWYELRYNKQKFDVTPDRLDRAIQAILYGWNNTVNRLVNYTWARRSRIKIVRIDNYDSWSADHTLALIIHPILVNLRANSHGAPNTDDEDVPVELQSTSAPPKENRWDTDEFHFARWEWILNEMIWTFKNLSAEDEESQFFHKGKKTDKVPEGWEWISPVENERGFWVDRPGEDAYHKRIGNGLRLFGKYYRALWD